MREMIHDALLMMIQKGFELIFILCKILHIPFLAGGAVKLAIVLLQTDIFSNAFLKIHNRTLHPII